jgi:hypothetical protein
MAIQNIIKKLFPKREIERILERLLVKAEARGLPKKDVQNAKEMLEHNECELCFDILAAQLYEYSIPVDQEFVDLAAAALAEMNIKPGEYDFLYELVNVRG